MDLNKKLQEGLNIIARVVFLKRSEMNIGKKKFGELCNGLSETYVRKIENSEANITINSLVKLKNGMSCTIFSILSGNAKKISPKSLQKATSEDLESAKHNFSVRLYSIMRHRKLNSINFSNYLDMDESATNKYFQGTENPTYLMMLRFAYVLDVEVMDFFNYDGRLPSNINYKPRHLNP